jgi:hypothetical protein
MKKIILQLSLALLCLLFVCQLSFADGVFIPAARKKIPDIPVQRAIIKYEEGTESLIIESSLNGEGGDYSWIIPVPTPPTKFDKVSPGLLKTMSLQIQPKIHHIEPYQKVFGIDIFYIFTILVMIGCFCIMRWGMEGSYLPLALIVLFIMLVPNFISYRSGLGSSSKLDPFIKITNNRIVGDYELFVLEVQDSSALNTWLGDNGFSQFPPETAQIIEDYISRNWVFTVAKLRTDLDGIATPRPVLIEFDTDQPVYPMRLTVIPDSPVYLELYVVSEEEAVPVNYNLQKEYCNFFDYLKIPKIGYRSPVDEGFIPREFSSLFMEIAHPDASKVMWDGCVVTKFAGEVSSNQMTEDMFFRFKDATPFQTELYSSVGAYNKAYNTLWVIFLLGSIILTMYYCLRKSLGTKVSILKLFIILIVSGVIGFNYSYAKVGKIVNVYSTQRYWVENFQGSLVNLFCDPSINFSNGPELSEILQKNGITNPITGEPIIIEQSPGNIIVETTGDNIVMKICLENGSLYKLFY